MVRKSLIKESLLLEDDDLESDKVHIEKLREFQKGLGIDVSLLLGAIGLLAANKRTSLGGTVLAVIASMGVGNFIGKVIAYHLMKVRLSCHLKSKNPRDKRVCFINAIKATKSKLESEKSDCEGQEKCLNRVQKLIDHTDSLYVRELQNLKDSDYIEKLKNQEEK